jgi:lipopolysaccharide/colanic/teichoic acid biosynthesis glycosyltransferase
MEYLEKWSVALELGIILQTIWQVIRPPPMAY